MSMKNSNNNDKNKDKDNNINNINNMSQEDIESLELLNIQKIAQIMFIYSDILAYISTLEGIQLIYSKYNSNSENMFNPDIPAVQSAYIAILAKSIITQIGFTRFSHIYEKYINGEIDYSINPNININIGNVLGLISYSYLLVGVKGIYERDLSQPIFGV